MSLELQFKIKNNPNYLKYLREHSYWYKSLNRDPNTFKRFEEEVKVVYKLRPSDRIGKALDAIEILENLLTTIR